MEAEAVFSHTQREALIENCAAVIIKSGAIHISQRHLIQMFNSLLDLFEQKLEAQAIEPMNLTEWGLSQHQNYQAPLSLLIQSVFALRSSLPANLAAPDALTAFDDKLTQAVGEMTNAFPTAAQELLTQRVSEMEDIARELARATEEADHTLVQLQSLYDISRQLSARLDVTEILQEGVKHLTQLTAAHSCAAWVNVDGVFRIEAGSDSIPLDWYENISTSMIHEDEPPENNCLWQAWHHREAILVKNDEAASFDKTLMAQMAATTILAIPLAVHEKVIGIITLHSRQDQLAADIDLAGTIVQQTAAAMKNGQLYKEVQQLNQSLERRIAARTEELVVEKERLETIYAITARLTTTLDTGKLINQTLHQLAEMVHAQDGMVFLNEDAYSSDLTCEASLQNKNGLQRPTGIYAQLSNQVFHRRQAMLVEDLTTDERWPDCDPWFRSCITAPLTADRDIHGVILLSHTEPHQFSTAQMRMVEAVSIQLAAAINNANLHGYVTEQVIRLDELLRTQELDTGQKQAILASIGDGVIAIDNKTNIILVNPAAEHILAVARANLLGQPISQVFDLFESVGRQKISREFWELQKQPQRYEDLPPEETPEVILEINGRVINARLSIARTPMETIGIVMVLRDITREVEADRAKSDFISTVSHELRTPMTSIKGYVDLMSQGVTGSLTDQQSHFLDVVTRNANRLSLLINDLLDISRIESGKVKLSFKEIELTQLTEQVVETLLIPAQNKGLTLTLETTPDLPLVMADGDRMVQVLTNLIGNAIAYTEAGGIQVCLNKVADVIQVAVQDSGVGISPKDLPHIFDQFYRAEDPVVQANSGTGLGLAIVQTFIELHSGRIWVESEPGVGTTFIFILPVAGKTAESEAALLATAVS